MNIRSNNSKGFVATGVVALVASITAAISILVTSGSADAADNHRVTDSGVYKFEDGSMVDPSTASASLVRTKSGVTAVLNTADLDPKTTYTMWWVIFNDPQECENPVPGLTTCGENDLLLFGGKPEINSSVLFASGNVIGGTGFGSFGAHLQEHFLPKGNGQVAWGPGLVDSKKAEVHLVLRSHGPAIPEIEREQISTFGGGCTEETDPSETGPVGPFACIDQQFAVFVP